MDPLTPPDIPFGRRLRALRERAGKTRAVLGGLVGRSAEWVKAVESGRILTPRLPMLLRLAQELDVTELAELTGGQSLPVNSVTKTGHPACVDVAAALNRPVRINDAPADVSVLAGKTTQAWRLWHSSGTERTTIAVVLPELIADARAAVRSAQDAGQRRGALAELARVYHLVQLFMAFQPAEHLVWLAADRAMTAAQDADDPAAIAAAAWYYSHVYRFAGQPDAAADVAMGAAALLDQSDPEQRARWGQLQLAAALASAKAGRAGLAWRHYDAATAAAGSLGGSYVHPWLMFGRAAVDAYGVTIEADLVRVGEAVRRVNRFDVSAIPSRTRRAAYLVEAGRAYHLRREDVAAVHLLGRALRESVETVRHSIFTRRVVLDLLDRPGPARDDARELALAIGLIG